MQMEVARALTELKLVKARMSKALEGTAFFGVSVGGKPVSGFATNDEFAKKSQSACDSYRALGQRYAAVKSAIAVSNATTRVSVGGREMTVAEAIERKRNLPEEEFLVLTLRDHYVRATRTLDATNLQAQAKLENFLVQTYGSKDVKLNPEQHAAVAAPFVAQFEAKLVHPEGMKERLDAFELEIATFKAEVDYALNRSNALTEIEVPE